jgi:hypothetical protein
MSFIELNGKFSRPVRTDGRNYDDDEDDDEKFQACSKVDQNFVFLFLCASEMKTKTISLRQ